MEILQVVNEVANLFTLVNATLFYIFIFGREVPKIEALPNVMQYLLRIGLALPALGALYNVLYVSYPPVNDIIVNVGYGFLWTWASLFHYNTFIRK